MNFENIKNYFINTKEEKKARKDLAPEVLKNIFYVKLESTNPNGSVVVPVLVNADGTEFKDLLTDRIYPVVLCDTRIDQYNDEYLFKYEIKKTGLDLTPQKYKFYSKITGKEIQLYDYDEPIYGACKVLYGLDGYGIIGYKKIPLGQRGIGYNLINDIKNWQKWNGWGESDRAINYVDFSEMIADHINCPCSVQVVDFQTERSSQFKPFVRAMFKIDSQPASFCDVMRVGETAQKELNLKREKDLAEQEKMNKNLPEEHFVDECLKL